MLKRQDIAAASQNDQADFIRCRRMGPTNGTSQSRSRNDVITRDGQYVNESSARGAFFWRRGWYDLENVEEFGSRRYDEEIVRVANQSRRNVRFGADF